MDSIVEDELMNILAIAHKDLEQGNYQVIEDVDSHIAEVMNIIKKESREAENKNC